MGEEPKRFAERPVHILVADDDPEILFATCRALEEAGYMTLRATDGAKALEQVRSLLPDLVLLDSEMPELDGGELCRQIKADPALCRTFVVMASDVPITGDDQALGLQNGADGFIARPVSNRELLARIEAYVRIMRLQQALHSKLELLEGFNEELRNAARQREEAEAQLQFAATVFNNAAEGIFVTDATGAILAVNRAFTTITGYRAEEVLGKNPRLLQSGRHGKEFFRKLWSVLLENGSWYGEITNRRKNGEEYAQMLTISAIFDPAGAVQKYVALFADVTPIKKRHMEQMEYVARHDALTGLPNRAQMVQFLEEAVARCAHVPLILAVAYLDLDNFKLVNQRFGAAIGDQFLVALAQRMRAALPESDLLARLGGDEFVAVLVGNPAERDFGASLNRLLRAVSDPMQLGETRLQLTASIGVSFYPQKGADAGLLFRQADQAMVLAKKGGRNRCHIFDVERDVKETHQREGLDRIRRGIDDGEFQLYYQPKVHLRSGRVVGAEALLRWNYPGRGVLPPGHFLPSLTDPATNIKLGEWVIETALAQCAAWRSQGLSIPVSVNVGADQLQQDDFGQRIRNFLQRHPQLPPSMLEIEILETSALQDVLRVSEHILACRGFGVHFALDDFGTGYSPLTYLKRLPVEVLKIDQSFVQDALEDIDDLAIVQSVIGLGQVFRRQVIAEGVETEAHGKALLQLGCELAQGYFIARPMPAAELAAWIAQWQPPESWKNTPVASADGDTLTALFAEVEHRHWLRSLFLAPTSGSTTVSIPFYCRLERWLRGEGELRYGGQESFQQLVDAHQGVHELGYRMGSRQPCPPAEQEAALGRLSAALELLRQPAMHPGVYTPGALRWESRG